MSDAKDVLGLVPEAYFDLIARMAPGIVAMIAIAVDPNVVEHIEPLEQFFGKAGLVLISLLVAYVLGLILDVTGDAISELVIVILNKISNLGLRSNIQLLDQVNRQAERASASIFIKIMAEKVAFRSLFLLAVLIVIFPSFFAGVVLPLSAKIMLSIIFLLLHLRMEYHLRKRVPNNSN